jgi:hypothetical protein
LPYSSNLSQVQTVSVGILYFSKIHPLVTIEPTMDGAARRAAELAARPAN